MNNITKRSTLIQSLCNSLRYKAGKGKPKKPTRSKSSKPSKDDLCKKRSLPGKEAEKADSWRKICLFGILPAVIGLSALILTRLTPHEREPFAKYEYMRKRWKRFPWGEGQRSLFHNSHLNALPDGYEDDDD